MKSSQLAVQRLIAIGTVKAARWMVQSLDDPGVSDTVKQRNAATLLSRGGHPEMLRTMNYDPLGIAATGHLADMTDAELEEAIRQYESDHSAVLPDQTPADPRFVTLQDREVTRSATPTRG